LGVSEEEEKSFVTLSPGYDVEEEEERQGPQDGL
jgi:hypothetical protein